MSMSREKKNCVLGRAALFAMTFIWGTSFVVLKNTIDVIPTLYVLAFRFSGAAVLMLLIGIKQIKKLDSSYLKGGVVMGLFLFMAYALQTFGLEQTTPGKNAFLTTTYCILVPFLYWIIAKKRPDKFNVIAAVICFAGVGFVSLEKDLSVNTGDLLTLSCGLFFGLHIIATGKFVEGRSVALLTMVQFAVAGVLAWIFAGVTAPFPANISMNEVWSLLYLCVMCTAVCYVLQTYGQRYTPPSATALIMTLESVFGVVISVALGVESLNFKLIVGFLLIFFAVVMSETKFSFLKKSRPRAEMGKIEAPQDQ